MEKVTPHRHCVICGKAVFEKEFFCSEECEKRYNRNRGRQRIILVVLVIIIILMFAISKF